MIIGIRVIVKAKKINTTEIIRLIELCKHSKIFLTDIRKNKDDPEEFN